jgi:hypothetical protein
MAHFKLRLSSSSVLAPAASTFKWSDGLPDCDTVTGELARRWSKLLERFICFALNRRALAAGRDKPRTRGRTVRRMTVGGRKQTIRSKKKGQAEGSQGEDNEPSDGGDRRGRRGWDHTWAPSVSAAPLAAANPVVPRSLDNEPAEPFSHASPHRVSAAGPPVDLRTQLTSALAVG